MEVIKSAKLFSESKYQSGGRSGILLLLMLTTLGIGWFSGPSTAQNDEVAEAIEFFELGQDRHAKGELREAEEFYKKALEKLPDFPEALYQLGTIQLGQGDKKQAEANFRKALQLRPDWTLAMTSLASLLSADGKLAEAKALVTDALRIDPLNPPAVAVLADTLLRSDAPRNELEAALAKATSLSEKANPTAVIWWARAALEKHLGKLLDARKSALRSLSIDSGYLAAHFLLFDIGIETGDLELSKESLSKLRSAGSPTETVLFLGARIAAGEGRLDDAENLLRQLSNRTIEAEELAKKIRLIRSLSTSALETELEASPNDLDILLALCNAYRVSDTARSLAYCRRGAELAPQRNEFRLGLGAALVQAKQYDLAVRELTEAVAAEPQNYTARANLAIALFRSKRYEAALSEFRKLTEDRPTSSIAYYFLGIIHDELKEYADAAASYNLFLKYADPAQNSEEILQAETRLPQLMKLINQGKGKRKD
jgi:tetratricopeptide (TPR) repeat protein